MKQIFTLTIILISSILGHAQSDSINQAFSRISALESQINKLTSDVEAVTKQNLALKKSLKLKPTIAKAKLGEDIEFRVLEVKGDVNTTDVHLIITIENIGNEDTRYYFKERTIIDELGNGYDNEKRSSIAIKGISENLFGRSVELHPNAPYTTDLCIKNYNPDAQYIKTLKLSGGYNKDIFFENLPIKWEEEE